MSRFNKRVALVVAASAAFVFLTMGIRQSFGLFLEPITADLEVSRQSFSIAIAVQNLLWGLLSPIFGMLADRHGPARVGFAGGLFYIGGLVLMGAATTPIGVNLGQGLVGAGLAGAGFSVVLGAVGKMAKDENRSAMLGIVTASGSLGQFAVVLFAQELLEMFGWRGALYGLAAMAVMFCALAPGLRLGSNAALARGHSATQVLSASATNRGYVYLTLGFFVCGFQVVFVATHFPAYLAEKGVSANAAVLALSMVGLFNIFGSLFCGWAGGRYSKKNSLAIFYLMRSLIMAAFLLVPLSAGSAIAFGVLIGFFWLGTVPLTSSLIAVFFGPRHMSMLYGVTFFSHQLGSAAGAWMGGAFYDAFGNYNHAWFFAIAMGVVAALLHYPIIEKRDRQFMGRFDRAAA